MTQRLFQPSFAGGELSPALYARTDLGKYAIGLRKCRNFIVHRTGGVSNRAGFEYLGPVADETVPPTLIPFRFNNTSQVCLLEFGEKTMRIWYQGGLIEDSAGAVVSLATPYTAAEAAALSHAQSGDVLYLAHPSHAPAKLERASWTNWTFTTLTFAPDVAAPGANISGQTLVVVRTPAADLTPSGTIGSVTVSATVTTSTYDETTGGTSTTTSPAAVFAADDVGRILKGGGGKLVITSVASDLCAATGTATTSLSGTSTIASGTWTINRYATVTSSGWSAALSGSTHSYTETLSYKVSVISESTGEESLPSEAISLTGPTADDWPVGTKVKLTGTALTDVAYYRVYKAVNGMYGYIGLADGDTATFEDTNITPDVSDGPPEATNPFAAAGDYPAVVAIHQQRLCFAATNNKPHGLWMSRTGFFENFSKSQVAKSDDSITVSLGSGEINAIKGLLSVQDLIILTSGSENVCNGGSTGEAVSASSTGLSVKPQSYWGSGGLPPLCSGNTCLYLQGLGSAVRDLFYDYSVDGFVGTDRSILARHLLDGHAIVSWAYAQVPDSTFWLVRDDGALLSLTYFREQDVGAWALHTTSGRFERVAVIEGDDRHELHVVVRRSLNGTTRRFVERLATRHIAGIADAAFLDAHLVYDGDAIATLSGLDHLAGATVGVLADGNVLNDLTVSAAGTITLPRAASHVVAGLRYDDQTWIETLDIDLGQVQGLGTVQGRRMSLPRLTVRVEASREFKAGPDLDHLTLTKVALGSYGATPDLFTGDVELTLSPTWTGHGRVVIRPNGPVPLTVLAISPDIVIGG